MNTMAPATTPTVGQAPRRGEVFLQTLWRAAIVCFVGGMITSVGSAVTLAIVITQPFGGPQQFGDDFSGAPSDAGFTAGAIAIAIFLGLVIGIVPAILTTLVGAPGVAGIAAGTLVPFRSAHITRFVPAAVLVVFGETVALLCVIVLFQPNAVGLNAEYTTFGLLLLFVPPVVITAFVASFGGWWTTRWYVKRMVAPR